MVDSTNAVTKTGIPLFNGTNFNKWLFRVKIALDEKDLSKYIEGKLDDLLALQRKVNLVNLL